ncbi:uncharacterized methyltransferase At1g78140, chloroplastic-like isoform X2 [Andrographis paniculata]|uniref:uncharacterized methyltransferase At1g78140, chloroplastic-like isoform X2 n=1 Tax=Andrographis paniculata TaxID=175694 RepID=UPI0021E8DE08|nr:uncharacterized methyltransferase At1g78140, chloroplastic-like isoform X2 [Andrographis paniculata]
MCSMLLGKNFDSVDFPVCSWWCCFGVFLLLNVKLWNDISPAHKSFRVGITEAPLAESMAAIGGVSFVVSSVSGARLNPERRRFGDLKRFALAPRPRRYKTLTVAASSASAAGTLPDPVVVDDAKSNARKNILACPICYKRLTWNVDPGSSLESVGRSTLQCHTCQKSYSGKDSYLDMTIAGGGNVSGESMAASTEFFRFPLISYLYERGWRQSFSVLGGFPGPEKEFELIKDYIKPVSGGNIIDASCGSGMFSRLFAKSGLFSAVVALDFSESMLQQCFEFVKQEDNFPEENLILVRADISRLPFASSTVDAVHAGAAMHCWPSPSAAVAEISRVLKPGGTFVASTYILNSPFTYIPLAGPLRQVSGSHIFWSEKELEDLCTSCGLVNFSSTRNRRFVMISAMKPLSG